MNEFCSSFVNRYVAIRNGVFVDEKSELDEDFIDICVDSIADVIVHRINNTDILLVVYQSRKAVLPFIYLTHTHDEDLRFHLLDDKSKLMVQLNDYINSDEDFECKLLNVIKIVSSRFKTLTDEPFIIGQTKSANRITVLPVNHA